MLWAPPPCGVCPCRYSYENAPVQKELSALEVGATAAFLASPLASAITGARAGLAGRQRGKWQGSRAGPAGPAEPEGLGRCPPRGWEGLGCLPARLPGRIRQGARPRLPSPAPGRPLGTACRAPVTSRRSALTPLRLPPTHTATTFPAGSVLYVDNGLNIMGLANDSKTLDRELQSA